MLKVNNVADDLLNWANEEFNFPVPREVAQRLCRGHMVKVWPFLTRHLRSLQCVRDVRQLIYKNETVSFNVFQNSENLITDVNNKKEQFQELLIADENIKTACNELAQLRDDSLLESRAGVFISENTAICRHRILQYHIVEQQLQSFLNILVKESKFINSAEYFSREKLNGQLVLSTQATKLLNDQFNALYQLLLKMAWNKFECGTDKIESLSLNTIFENCKAVFKKYLFEEVTEYFSTQTEERMEVIQGYIDSVNLNKDMENLQFLFKPMFGFVDKSRMPKDIASQVSLVLKAELRVIEKGIENRQLKTKNSSLSEEVEKLQTNNLINEMSYSDQDKSLVREMVELELNLYSTKANLEFLMDTCSVLESDLEKVNLHQASKKLKFLDIQRFSEHKIKKQTLIRSLIQSSVIRCHKLRNKLKLATSSKQIISGAISKLKTSSEYPIITNEVRLVMQLSKLPVQVAKLNNSLTFPSLFSINTIRNMLTDNHSEFFIKKSEENYIFDLTDLLLHKSTSEILDSQQHYDVLFDPSDLRHLLKTLQADYSSKVNASQSKFREETVYRTDWKSKFDNLKSCVDIWWNQPFADMKLPCAIDNVNYQQWENKWIIDNQILKNAPEDRDYSLLFVDSQQGDS